MLFFGYITAYPTLLWIMVSSSCLLFLYVCCAVSSLKTNSLLISITHLSWAHGAISSLMDRIKIVQKGKGTDINLSIQYILNCGAESAGSCHGG